MISFPRALQNQIMEWLVGYDKYAAKIARPQESRNRK